MRRRPAALLAALLVAAAACCAPRPALAQDDPALAARAAAWIAAWRDAWQAEDLAGLMARYADDAEARGRSRAAFEEHERRVFASPGTPRIAIGDLAVDEIVLNGERLVRARFDQRYESPALADFGEKELLLRPAGDGFLVVRETWRATDGDIAVPLGATPQPAPGTPVQPGPVETTAPGTAPPTPPPAPGEGPLLGEGYRPPADVTPESRPVDDLVEPAPLLGPGPRTEELEVPGLPPPAADRRVVEEIVASVNGRILTRTMYLERLRWYQDSLYEQDPPDLEQRLARLAQEALDTTIDRWLVLSEAKDHQADVEGFWRDWLGQFRRTVGAETTEELEQLLEEQGSSLERLKEQVVETEVPNIFIQREIADRLTFSDAEVRARFDREPHAFGPPRRVSLRQVLVPVEPGVDPRKSEGIADLVIEELKAGRDWCELHALYSAPAPDCGQVTNIALTDLLPELREAAAGLPAGAVSTPLRSTAGVHVLQVTDRSALEPVAFEAVKDQVRARLREEAHAAAVEDFLADLRRRGEVRVDPRYREAADAAGGVSQ